MDNESLLAGVVIGYAAGAATTWAAIMFGASLRAGGRLFTPRRRLVTPSFAAESEPLPKVSTEVRRIVPREGPESSDSYTFPMADENGLTVRETVPARYLARFIAMPDISRGNWNGDKGVYSQILRIAEAYGWIRREDGRKYTWSDEYRTLGRRVSRLAENRIVLPPP